MFAFLSRRSRGLSFKYSALDWKDRLVEGIISASSFDEAYHTLDKRYPTLIKVEQVDPDELEPEERPKMPVELPRPPAPSPLFYAPPKGKLSVAELSRFARQMATMLHAGLPITRALGIIAEGDEPRMAAIGQDIARRIKEGSSLSAALRRHPKAFSPVHLSLIQCGEASGKLEESFERLASLMEQQHRLRSSIFASVSYPVTLAVVSGVMLFLFVTFILPRGMEVYEGFHFQLPAATRLLLAIMRFCRSKVFWEWMAGVFLLLAMAVLFLTRHPIGRRMWDRLVLNLPVLGEVTLKICVSRTLYSFTFLAESGVPFSESCELASKASGSTVVEERFAPIARRMAEGESLREAFGESGLFSSIILSLIETGEQSGRLLFLLREGIKLCEDEIKHSLDVFVKLLEPALLVAVSVVVALISISAFLPAFTLIQNL